MRSSHSSRIESAVQAYQQVMPWLLMLIGAVFGYAIICGLPHEVADEGFHAPQIWGFYSGSYVLGEGLTTLPGYHYTLALVLRQIGTFDIDLIRLLSAAVALLALPVFHQLVRGYYSVEGPVRTAQLFFLPVLFPFFFLIYTDAWTLVAVLYTILLTLRRQHLLAAAIGLAGLFLRQTSIVWVGLAFLLACFDRPDEDEPACAGFQGFIKGCLTRGWPYLVVFALFAAFVVYNGGVSIGDRQLQQSRFNITNLYFLLLLGWMVFLPYNLARLPDVLRLLRRPWVAAASVVGLFIYLGTYKVTHQYNDPGLSFYVRNRLLALMTSSLAWRAVFYIPILWMTLSVASTRLPERRLNWLYIVGPLSICLHPMVEVRYNFPALALFLAWRQPVRPGFELATIAYYLPIAAYLTYSISRMHFFL